MDLIERFGSLTGKTDSMYTYCLFQCSRDRFIEHIENQIVNIKKISDAYKRTLYLSRYNAMRDFVDCTEEQTFNCILLVHDRVEYIDLTKNWISILTEYQHQPITFCYDTHFDIEFLRDLLERQTFYEIFRFDQSTCQYIRMTKTKKYIVTTVDTKSMNLEQFISGTQQTNRSVICGINSKLKNYKSDRCIIINKPLKDTEIIDMFEQIDQEDVLDSFEQDLLKTDRLVYKKDIERAIVDGKLQKIYLETNLSKRFMENIKKHDITANFKIIIIDQKIKSLTDDREKKIMLYGGVVGITYY